MGYNQLVKDSVDLAFNLLGDLAQTFTFSKVTNNSFNFATGALNAPTINELTIKGVMVTSRKAYPKHNTTMTKVIVKTKDVGDISSFDKFVHNTITYKIGPVITNDGYIVEFEAFREI